MVDFKKLMAGITNDLHAKIIVVPGSYQTSETVVKPSIEILEREIANTHYEIPVEIIDDIHDAKIDRRGKCYWKKILIQYPRFNLVGYLIPF